jgi:hypothetical protein
MSAANLIAGKVGDKLLAKSIGFFSRVVPAPSAPAALEGRADPFALMLAEQSAVYSQAPSADALSRKVEALRTKVRALQGLGIQCVFVEMPVDRSLMNLPLATAVRTACMESFPPDQFGWVRPSSLRQYKTGDGLHLIGEEARSYAAEVRRVTEGSDAPGLDMAAATRM